LSLKSRRKHRDAGSLTTSFDRGGDPKGYDDDDVTEEEIENVGTVTSPLRHFLDTRYGKRRDGEQLMIGDSPAVIDTDDDVTNKGTVFRGTEGLWDLFTRKNVNTQLIGKEDLKTYKKVLVLINAHLNRYQPGDNSNIKRGK